MELKTIFSNVESYNKNVIWLTVINGVGSPSSPNSLYGEYVNNGGSKTKEEFNEALFNLIG